jgi:hypothetical protein
MKLVQLMPRRKRILFADNIHFHYRNYKTLFRGAQSLLLKCCIDSANKSLKQAHGNYNSHKHKLSESVATLKQLDSAALFNYQHFGISLFPLIKSEMLSYILPKPNWIEVDIAPEDEWIFLKAYRENKNDLLLNMSAAIFWLEAWKKALIKVKKLTYCVMFGGSLTYNKCLNALLENTAVRVFKTEHFVTGNAYYFEEKYTAIPNKSDVVFENYYQILLAKVKRWSPKERAQKEQKALACFLNRQNKNVSQPRKKALSFIKENNRPYLLIIGQVLNDFSLIDTNLPNINSIRVYCSLIKKVLDETNYHIIFKAHPWERAKIHLKSPVTRKYIERFVYNNLNEKQQERIVVLEEVNLSSLIAYSQQVVALNSQALLEVAFEKKKPSQIGRAFFGFKGFTSDFNNETTFVESLKKGTCESNLTDMEYQSFLLFLTAMLEEQLVRTDKTGIKRIREKIRGIL